MDITRMAIALYTTQGIASYVADDTDIGIVVRYVGSEASGTVTVASGDITFKHGDLASEAVDATIDSGGDDPGVIDVSDATADTMGEVVDLINGSANWEAYLAGCLRADASAGYLLNKSATQAKTTAGIVLYKDTSAALNLGVSIDVKGWNAQKSTIQPSFGTAYEPTGKRCGVLLIDSYNTYGSGTSLIEVYEIDRANNIETKIYSRPGGATTVEQNLDFSSLASLGGIQGSDDYSLMVRMVGSAACTGWLSVVGYQVDW